MKEMQSEFERKLEEMQSSMDGQVERHKVEVQTMERSKYELIEHTAKEIDSLRQIIKDHFQTRHQEHLGGVNNGNLKLLAFKGLLNWT